MNRARGWVVIGAVAVAVLSPLLRSPPRDSYPLSTYPMFSDDVPAERDLSTVLGVDGRGVLSELSPVIISASDEVMQASQDVGDAVASGQEATQDLCAAVAARAAARGEPIVEVRVVTRRYDVVAWFGGSRAPLAEVVHSSCEVSR